MADILLPRADRTLSAYTLGSVTLPKPAAVPNWNRIVFAAAHVVTDPLSNADPSGPPVIDWEPTLAFRAHLLGLGFGIAEAMDTAQRGMGLDWPNALELVKKSLAAAKPADRARIFSGVGTDQLLPADARSLDDVTAAYLEQLHAVQKLGGRVILMASRALARVARSPDDYRKVYARVLSEADQPVILHWLGEMFDPALSGYWGGDEFAKTLPVALGVISDSVAKVDGIKISLLDAEKEIFMRRQLPQSVKMYTGDDFNYPELIAGDGHGFSHALLGIFDPIAPAAAVAFDALASGDRKTYDWVFAPTVPLARLIFESPTRYYKSGVVFLAYLNGFQDHFVMIGGQQAMRSVQHYADIFRLADQAGLLRDREMAVARMRRVLALSGIGV